MRPQALIVASKLAKSAAHVMRAPCACSKNTDATVRHFHAQMHDAIIAGGPARSHAPCAKQNLPQLGCVLGQEKTERPHSPKRLLFLPRRIRIQVSDQRCGLGLKPPSIRAGLMSGKRRDHLRSGTLAYNCPVDLGACLLRLQ